MTSWITPRVDGTQLCNQQSTERLGSGEMSIKGLTAAQSST